MNKTIKLPDNRVITVVSPENAAAAISPSDAEMDYRAREAVKAAIHKAKVCKKPMVLFFAGPNGSGKSTKLDFHFPKSILV